MLLTSINLICALSFAQSRNTIYGLVTDTNNQVLYGASVRLQPSGLITTTDEKGNFIFGKLDKGKYRIDISFLGFESHSDSIDLDGNKKYKAQLSVSAMDLQEVTITDNYAETRKKEESLNIDVLSNRELKQNLGGSLMKSLEHLPGVGTIDIGSGQSKPVIRGLSFNRVVVVENNIKHEAQQWGADHGLEIDQYAIDHIEVIKGPASLMYGSDAIGGIINLTNKNLPATNTWGGTIDLSGKTNNNFGGTSVSLYGRKKEIFAQFRATLLRYGDYKVPTDSVDIYSYRAPLYKNQLRNTAGKEENIHFSVGLIRTRFQSRFYMSNVFSKNGFFANAHGLEPRQVNTEVHDKSSRDVNDPFQEVSHFKLVNKSQYWYKKLKIESDLGFQRNFRQEWSQYVNHGFMPALFPDTLHFDSGLERQFKKYVYSGNLNFSYQKDERPLLSAGLSSEFQDNRIDGRGFIIPAYTQLSMGSFVFGKFAFSEKSTVQLGVRYDWGILHTREYFDWFPSPIDKNDASKLAFLQRAEKLKRSFSSLSWSVGYNLNSENWSVKTNIGKSFRMPTAKELAANGVNYHHFSYEVGNAQLTPEISYQLDAGISYTSEVAEIGVTPFLNYFSNYIYLNPSSEHDRLYGNGNQIYYYTQSRVFRYGTELYARYHLTMPLQIGIVGEYVYSEQISGDKKGFTLPFSPPASVIFNARYEKKKIGFVRNSYLSIDYKLTSAQTNIVPPEEKTDGHQVINMSMGGDIAWKNQKISILLQLQNLLNSKYFNHTSYYRLINVPEAGRNFILNISIPFSGKTNK